jgi:thymidylate synthase (FAD)
MQVELLDYFGNDEMVANVARVSYQKEASNYTEEQNAKLLKYLWNHKHTSPFRHPQLQFRIKCAIYVERQLFKHQAGISTNSVSGRYVDFSDSYSEIDVWRKQATDSKQGSSDPVDELSQKYCSAIQKNVIKVCKESYERLLALGVSKEQARSILPLNLETEFIWTGSLQAFMHMCSLRLKPDAQKETRDVVAAMLQAVQDQTNGAFKQSLSFINTENHV